MCRMIGNGPKKRKIVWLLVEDDPSLRAMLSAMLTIWDYEPLAFSDGHEAMKWLDDVEAGRSPDPLPELALLDIRMPGPQGHEIGHRLRQMRQTANIPIVVMTAFRMDASEMEEITRLAQPDRMITKPLPAPDQFKAMLDEVLASRGHGAS